MRRGSYKSFLSTVKSDIGTLESIRLEPDPSGRINKVKLTGSEGSRYIAGWLYKSAWNIWVASELPTGEKDFIYSLTYFKVVAD